MPQSRPRARSKLVIAGWLVFAAVAGAIIWAKLTLTVDLAFFLPAPETRQEQVLIDRLGQGPGSRLLFITLSGIDPDALETNSGRLKHALEQSSLFTRILNGREELSTNAIPREIWQYRYLLTDIDWSIDGLRAALRARLADLSVLSGNELTELIAADPYFASLDVAESLAGPGQTDDVTWINADRGVAYLIAETSAPALDVGAQAAALRVVRDNVAALDADPPQLFGVGAYGVGLQDAIRSEARRRSLLASAAIMAVLFLAYRNLALLLLAAWPLALGALAGLAGVALLFDRVHGITLAFGFTLFGVAIDYPLHLFSHAQSRAPRDAMTAVWRTMRLGAFSTVLAYLAFVGAGSQGLAQLGCLSAVGVLVALFATRSSLPVLLPRSNKPARADTSHDEVRPALRQVIWIAALVCAVVSLTALEGVWTNDLATLTPLPRETLQRDNAFRAAFGAPDIRYLLTIEADTEEAALQQTEALADKLGEVRADGVLESALTVTSILPSQAKQQSRRAALEAIGDLPALVSAASSGLPFRADAFDAFVNDALAMTILPPLTSDDFDDPLLRSLVSSQLYFDGERWTSAVTLYGLTDPERLADWLSREFPGVDVIDLKTASESLVLNYRRHILQVLGVAIVLIAGALLWRLGLGTRLFWVVGTLSGGISLTLATNALVLEQLSIFNLIALVLVAGLGLDYALFMSRAESNPVDASRTRHALRVCAGSTLVAFGVLALSSVPILASIGTTVATGVGLVYALAWLGARSPTRA